MKYSYFFIVLIIFFTGCSQKKVIEINYANKVDTQQKPIIKEKTKKDEVAVFEDIVIEEENLFSKKIDKFDIAVVYSSDYVSDYYKSSLNTILGYLNYRKVDFNIKGFDCVDESFASIESCINKVKEENYTKVIALFTPFSFDKLKEVNTNGLEVYLPLVEKQDDDRFIYGSINYNQQISKLMEFAYMNTTVIYQDNFLGNKLYDIHNIVNPRVDYSLKIDNMNNNYKHLIQNREILDYSSVFMYTNNVKASLLLSQMNIYEKYPSVILSTQQNYKPDIFELTQNNDRKNLLIVNSISKVNPVLNDDIETFGGDIKYNWVDYSVLIGVNYLFDKNQSKILKNEIIDNEVVYEANVYEVNNYGFLEIK